MTSVFSSILKYYHYINDEYWDQRAKGYLFMSSPVYILLIVFSYLYFVLKLGPSLMKNRQPFDLKKILIFYNVVQIIYNIWIFKMAFFDGWLGLRYQLICEPVNRSHEDPDALWVVKACWIGFILKLSDLLDTIFFVLRKKDKQITFLHVYHHALLVAFAWLYVRTSPGGHGVMFGIINSVVHAVMYFYYLLTNLSPEYRRSLWWKKYLTQMQMVQFFIIFLHNLAALLKEDCEFSKSWLLLYLCQSVAMMVLFYNFYRKAYSIKINKKP